MIVEVIGEIVMPKLYSVIVGHASDHLAAGAPGSVWYVAGIAGLMILTAVLMMLGGVGGAYFGAKASVNFASDLRIDVFRKVQKFSFANIDKFQTGSLVTRLTNDVTQMQNFVNMLLRMFLRAPGMLIGALLMAISLSRASPWCWPWRSRSSRCFCFSWCGSVFPASTRCRRRSTH